MSARPRFALKVPCPVCQAGTGKSCRLARWGQEREPHIARKYAALERPEFEPARTR